LFLLFWNFYFYVFKAQQLLRQMDRAAAASIADIDVKHKSDNTVKLKKVESALEKQKNTISSMLSTLIGSGKK
jgi:hypothetical protein